MEGPPRSRRWRDPRAQLAPRRRRGGVVRADASDDAGCPGSVQVGRGEAVRVDERLGPGSDAHAARGVEPRLERVLGVERRRIGDFGWASRLHRSLPFGLAWRSGSSSARDAAKSRVGQPQKARVVSCGTTKAGTPNRLRVLVAVTVDVVARDVQAVEVVEAREQPLHQYELPQREAVVRPAARRDNARSCIIVSKGRSSDSNWGPCTCALVSRGRSPKCDRARGGLWAGSTSSLYSPGQKV